MSNIGRVIPSQMSTFIDKKSGREIIKLTGSGVNDHLYFTENSFYSDDKHILYIHYDGNLNEGGLPNLYKMNLDSGESVQLTDFAPEDNPSGFNKSPDGEFITYMKRGELYVFYPESGVERLIARPPIGFKFGSTSVSFDKRYVAIAAVKTPEIKSTGRLDENYAGFKDQFYATKVGRIYLAPVDGSGEIMLFEDTHWVGHVQFAPDTNEFLTYCHEGPWNYVQERIWMLNTITRTVKPCYSQAENDSLGHEFWTRDGLVFYDNRGRGHDGTITSDKSQAVTMDYNGEEDIPKVGFIDKDCKILRELELPYYCNHYHANKDNTKLVADAVNDIVLIDISTDTPSFEVLCEHNTSWRYQSSHCHPTYSWSNDAILYRSDCDAEGEPQLYLIKT